jgi:hypothetical protein
MSDKPLSVDEIMKLVDRYAITWGEVGSRDRSTHEAWDAIRAELEKFVKAAGDPS